jgi:hypothetical protein
VCNIELRASLRSGKNEKVLSAATDLAMLAGLKSDSIYRGMMTATNNAYIKAPRVLV